MLRINSKAVYITGLLLALGAAQLCGESGAANAQLQLPPITNQLDRLEQEMLQRRLERLERERLENLRRTATDDVAPEVSAEADALTQDATDAVENAGQVAQSAAGDVADTVVETVDAALRAFVGGQDPTGADIEQDVIIVLVPNDVAGNTVPAGAELISRRNLPALGMSLWTLRRTGAVPLPQAVEDVRSAFPGSAVDYNHLYGPAGASNGAGSPVDGEEAPATGTVPSAGIRVGVIDSAVQEDHFALAGTEIVSRDFAAHEGQRPTTHGTAVASLVAKSSGDQAVVYSASVFFQNPGYAPGATAESLVAALDWLISERVHAINMSLAGPGNQLLETALANLPEDAPTIVAAVGNNGPSGPPLYPAAYDGVIGVTAVDRKQKIFRYANRGEHVDYAALGVNVKIADSETGGWRIESGTSMASPHVAVVVAQSLESGAIRKDAMMSWLMASAEDLGRRGFDPVFGHGLITRPPVVVSAN